MKNNNSHQLKALIVDDEALARRGLTLRLKTVDDVEIVGEARNGREALKMIRSSNPDLVFLDIQMPGMSGFDVVKALSPAELPTIVFVTAFDQYAINAFESNALDYLLKPIDDSRLHQALFKVREHLKQKRAQQHKRSLLKLVSEMTGESISSMNDVDVEALLKQHGKGRARLAIKDGGKTVWLYQSDIEWIDAVGDYMCVNAGGETYILRTTMKKLEQELDPTVLQRIHRSTIVNVQKVCKMQSHINGEYFLTLETGHTVKLSRSYKNKLNLFQ